jgi:hypothetical protein
LHPNIESNFAVWDEAEISALAAMQAKGKVLPMMTIDLGEEAAQALTEGTSTRGFARNDLVIIALPQRAPSCRHSSAANRHRGLLSMVLPSHRRASSSPTKSSGTCLHQQKV